MSGAEEKPLYLLDANISHRFITPFRALKYDMTSVDCQRTKGQLRCDDKGTIEDPTIIEWLGRQQTDLGRRSVWITADWEASKAHAKLIIAHSISVFWICDPRNNALRALQELQVLAMLIEHVDRIVRTDTCPIYLKGIMDNRRARLEKLASHLMAPRLEWKRVKL
ncbi:MAG: hypothetical protein M1531_09565 [Chloroflexi bacterium]|nr:hypothetical protein [Chloroflexota bacterium]